MTKINLREYYPFYKSDCFIDVPDEVAALLANVDAGVRTGQVDDHAPLAGGTAAEVDVAHRQATRADFFIIRRRDSVRDDD